MPVTDTPSTELPELQTLELGLCEYQTVWDDMRSYTQTRDNNSIDQIWYCQHHPVFTLGLNGKRHHLLQPTDIPVIPVDRGGQITYHGPGQLIAYLLIDINRLNISIKKLVTASEQAIINYLSELGLHAERKQGAPGIYIEGAKIAALGLRVKKGRTYHGLSFNVDMDLSPFKDINPCGYEGMPVTQLADLLVDTCPSIPQVKSALHAHLCHQLGYNLG